MRNYEEQQIIQRVLSGEKNAFEELVIANQKNVFNLAIKLVGDWNDALDISQEAFIKAFQQLGSFRAESRFAVWMYKLTYNLCIDFLRKKKRTATTSLSYEDDNGKTIDIEVADHRSLPENELISQEAQSIIITYINQLNAIHRQVLYMREVTAMSYSEMAIALSLSEGTVKSRLSRARRNLASKLNEDKYNYEEMIFSDPNDYCKQLILGCH